MATECSAAGSSRDHKYCPMTSLRAKLEARRRSFSRLITLHFNESASFTPGASFRRLDSSRILNANLARFLSCPPHESFPFDQNTVNVTRIVTVIKTAVARRYAKACSNSSISPSMEPARAGLQGLGEAIAQSAALRHASPHLSFREESKWSVSDRVGHPAGMPTDRQEIFWINW